MLVGVPIFDWGIVAGNIGFGEDMTARFCDERNDLAIGPTSIPELLDLVAYHVDESRYWKTFLS
ncbi:hypothetical protein EV283_3301 [Sphingomonas sp. BK036]|nr:hypothetical protein EV283_3301 [Sphingomonas sp. BK036]